MHLNKFSKLASVLLLFYKSELNRACRYRPSPEHRLQNDKNIILASSMWSLKPVSASSPYQLPLAVAHDSTPPS